MGLWEPDRRRTCFECLSGLNGRCGRTWSRDCGSFQNMAICEMGFLLPDLDVRVHVAGDHNRNRREVLAQVESSESQVEKDRLKVVAEGWA
eukprot:354306-Chlamydomonas_euryale.AAC.9